MKQLGFHIQIFSLAGVESPCQCPYQWWIQTGAMGCRKPMKTANLNLTQYINFVLGKNNDQGHDSIFHQGDDSFVQIRENSYETSCVKANYLPLEINCGNHQLISIPSIKLNKPWNSEFQLLFVLHSAQVNDINISMASVSGMTKPDNLLTGFILLLIVERRSGNLGHHPYFAICVFTEACWGCFYYSCVENFVTTSFPQVPVGCNSQQTLASLCSPEHGRDCFLPAQFNMPATCCGMHFWCSILYI